MMTEEATAPAVILSLSFRCKDAFQHLSWRPLLFFPCFRISYTEQDRFCGPAAQAALPSEILCRCMPDIFAQSGLRMASSQMAFSLHSLKHTVAGICSTNGFETVGPRNVPRDQPTRSSRRRNESHSLGLIPALRVKSGTSLPRRARTSLARNADALAKLDLEL